MKRMMLSVAVLALCVGGGIVAAQMAAPEAGLSARVVGLCLTKSIGDGSMMQPFNAEPGVSLAVLVETQGKTILKFNHGQSQLTSFVDDKGGNLLAPKGAGGGMRNRPFRFPDVAEDGKSVLFTVHGSNLPGEGASFVKAEGEVNLSVGTEKASERQTGVALTAGTKITVGPVPMEIKEASAGGDWGAAMTIKLKAAKDVSAISAIRFYDDAGREVKANVTSTMMMGFANTRTVVQEIALGKKLATADVVVEYWKDLEKVSVPFSVAAGLALK